MNQPRLPVLRTTVEAVRAESAQSVEIAGMSFDVNAPPEFALRAVRENDWSTLDEGQCDALTAFYCRQYGFNPLDGMVAVIRTKDGKRRPYVTAPGVFKLSRERLQRMTVEAPSVTEVNGVPAYVTVKAVAVTPDGRSFEAFGCKRITSYDVALMQADTAAKARACRLAVGISIMTFAEASSISDETIEHKEQGDNE